MLRPTPADNFPILAGIQTAELRRSGATLSLGRRTTEPGHLLHSALTRPSGAAARRLKSRHPFVPAAKQLISFSDNNNVRAAQWADHQWNAEWLENTMRLRTFIPYIGTHTSGIALPRTAWVRLFSLRTRVKCMCSCLHKLSTALWVWCRRTNRRPCCPPMSNPWPPPHGLHGLTVLDDETIECLLNTCTRSSVAKQWIEITG